MPHTSDRNNPTRGFWVISGVALLWNLIGIVTYLLSVTMSADALAALPDAERSLASDTPTWATSAYATAVFGGTAGSLGLLRCKAWAVPVLMVSLVGIVIQMERRFGNGVVILQYAVRDQSSGLSAHGVSQ